jgi:hypothetical protein
MRLEKPEMIRNNNSETRGCQRGTVQYKGTSRRTPYDVFRMGVSGPRLSPTAHCLQKAQY